MYKLCKKTLIHTFNASLSSGIVPDRLKLAKVQNDILTEAQNGVRKK
jgi:hypothetical protein